MSEFSWRCCDGERCGCECSPYRPNLSAFPPHVVSVKPGDNRDIPIPIRVLASVILSASHFPVRPFLFSVVLSSRSLAPSLTSLFSPSRSLIPLLSSFLFHLLSSSLLPPPKLKPRSHQAHAHYYYPSGTENIRTRATLPRLAVHLPSLPPWTFSCRMVLSMDSTNI